jgi:outer membrane protein assembly factor BamB
MKTSKIISIVISVFLFSNSFGQTTENWPQWRGSLGNGAAMKGNPPTQFSEIKNLKWKTAIPGTGHATPVVWEKNIIIQTAVATDEKGDTSMIAKASRMPGSISDVIHDFKVILVNRETGKIIWEKTVTREMPQEGTHKLGSWASNSPCTDGEFIYAYFGSRGLFCLDFQGNIIWKRDFGQLQKKMSFGEGESPYLYKDHLFIQWDSEDKSFMAALNKKTGDEVWRVERNEKTSWASPLVVDVNGKAQVITSATNQVRSYDYSTGEIIWTCTGMTQNVIPNPVYSDGILYVMSGFRGNALLAIDLARAKGDITGTDVILWTYNQDTPYTPNPLLMGGKLYFLRANNGELTCLGAKTGKVFYSKEKLEGISTLYSSPSGVGELIYVAAENICVVAKAGENFEILSSNILEDNFHASPVIVGNELFLRGFKSLYCFSEK